MLQKALITFSLNSGVGRLQSQLMQTDLAISPVQLVQPVNSHFRPDIFLPVSERACIRYVRVRYTHSPEDLISHETLGGPGLLKSIGAHGGKTLQKNPNRSVAKVR